MAGRSEKRATDERSAYMSESPRDAASRMDARLKIGAEQVLSSYDGLKIPSRTENIELMSGGTPALMAVATRLAKVMTDNKLLASRLSIESLLTLSPKVDPG